MSDFTINTTTGKASIVKDDAAVLDYTFDWSLWLAPTSDTIASKTVSIETGSDGALTIDSSSIVSIDATALAGVTAWISGGTVGQTYQVECKITTAQGRTDERSMYIKVRER